MNISLPLITDRRRTAMVAVIAVVGLLFVFLTPPYQTPDEQTHLYRAYQVSEGRIIAEKLSYGVGGTLPASLSVSFQSFYYLLFNPEVKVRDGDIGRAVKAPLQAGTRTETRFENTAAYPPVSYLPQAAAVLVGRLIGFGPVLLLYAARLANLAVWVAALWYIMKRNPGLSLAFFALALIPGVLFQTASANADVMTAALCLVLLSEVFRTFAASDKPLVARTAAKTLRRNINEKLDTRSLVVIAVLGGALGLCKFPYVLITAVVLAIPHRAFKDSRTSYLYKAGVIGGSLLLALLWLLVNRNVIINLREVANSSAQLDYIVRNPLSYLGVLIDTYVAAPSDTLYLQMVGFLGWLDTKLPLWTILGSVLAFWLAVLGVEADTVRGLTWRRRTWLAAVGLGLVLAITTILYLTWNAPRWPVVEGLQGRYFVPIFGIAILSAAGALKLARPQFLRVQVFVFGCLGATTLATVATVASRYYSF